MARRRQRRTRGTDGSGRPGPATHTSQRPRRRGCRAPVGWHRLQPPPLASAPTAGWKQPRPTRTMQRAGDWVPALSRITLAATQIRPHYTRTIQDACDSDPVPVRPSGQTTKRELECRGQRFDSRLLDQARLRRGRSLTPPLILTPEAGGPILDPQIRAPAYRWPPLKASPSLAGRPLMPS